MKYFIYTLFAALTLSFTGCGNSDGTVPLDEIDGTTPPVTLESIVVSSVDNPMINGTSTTLTAIGLYSNQTDKDITNDVQWASDAPNTVAINGNIATAKAVGNATIKATLNAVYSELKMSVVQAQLISLRIVEDDSTTFNSDDFVVGETIQAKALANFDNGVINRDVTEEVTWKAVTESTVTVNNTDNKGLITATNAGSATVKISYQGSFGDESNSTTGTVVVKTISSIKIYSDPTNAVENAGNDIKMQAWATYTNGSTLNISDTVVWTSDNKNLSITEDGKSIFVTSLDMAEANIKAVKNKNQEDIQAVVFERKVFDHIEIQDGYCGNGDCPVITGNTIDIPIVDNVSYDPVTLGAYYPTAWAIYTDGTKSYIGSSLGIRWWSSNQVKAYVNTFQGSFVFGRGLADKVEISVSYRGEHKTSFFVNVKQDTTTKTLQQIGIVNTKLEGWGCSQNDNYYGEQLDMNIGEEGKYLQACGKFLYSDGNTTWEDINNNVGWTSLPNDVARVQTTTGNVKALSGGTATISAILAEKTGTIAVVVKDRTPASIEIQGITPTDNTGTKVITGLTLDIPIVDNVNYDPVSIGAYYPKAYLVFTDGTKEYINSTSGIRWWSSNQVSAFLDTTRGSFVFGRGLNNGVKISVSYRGDNTTSFFVNVIQDTTTKTLKTIGIKNTKDNGWGCTQNDSDYGTALTVNIDDNGKYLQACGKFSYADGTPDGWEDINDNVAWFSTKEAISRVRTNTGELISKSTGSTIITAQVAGIDGNTTVTVTP